MTCARFHHALGAVICLLSAAGPGLAQAQNTETITVSGEADRRCTLGLPEQGDGALVNFDTPSGSVFAVTQLADPQTMSTQAANLTLSMAAMCNTLHRIVLASDNNGLWRQGGAQAANGFAGAVPYTANLVWAGEQHRLIADAGSRRFVEQQVLVGRPRSGDLRIEFQVDTGATNVATGAPLMAGEYADVLRITMEPQ